MTKYVLIATVIIVFLLVCSSSVAAISYVVTNDDNCNAPGNSSTIYTLNTSNGALTLLQSVNTGGVGNCGGFFATVGNAITRDAKCLFVADGGSNDIAAFALPSLKKVGNYSNAALNSAYPGGSMALAPNGNFLYATYAGSENIGAWKRNSDCSLTFINAYVASGIGQDEYSGLIVDPSGQGLIVSAGDNGGLELFLINQSSGALTDVSSTNFNDTACSSDDGCFPAGLDITRKELLIVGNSTLGSSAFTTQLITTPPYFSKVTYVDLTNFAGLCNNNIPWLSSAAYSNGVGALYFGFSGYGNGSGCQPGVLTAALTGSGVTVAKATAINSANLFDGTIQSTGNWMVVSEWPNQLQVFQINGDGSLTATGQGPVTDSNAAGALSFFIYPKTR